MTTSTTKPTTKPLTFERTFRATPERLWSYWTDPAKYAKWLNPAPLDLVVHEWDLREGGRVRFDMPQPDGNPNPQEGVFHRLDPYRELVSGSADKSFLLHVRFIPVTPETTRMVVTVTGVPPEHHAPATVGFNTSFDRLGRELEAGAARPRPQTDSATHGEPKGITAPASGRVEGRNIVLERWIKAPPEKVFAAWGNKDLLPRFFWPLGTGRVEHLDLRAGGELRMAHATEPWTAHWRFDEVVPGRRIVFRDIWPDGSGWEATGTMEFLAERGGTRLVSRFGPFPEAGPFQPSDAVSGGAMAFDRLAEELEQPGPGEGFRLVRVFDAPPSKVWTMWTTKAGLDKWWRLSARDMGYDFRVQALDVQVGGAYDIVMSNQEHGELHNHGVYTDVVPNRRLAYRWDFDIFLGPGEKAYPIQVSIDFEEVPIGPGKTGTKMTFTQGPLAKPGYTEGSRQGVRANFDHLQRALAQ